MTWVLSLITGGLNRLYLYAGVAGAALLFIATVLFKVRRSGIEAEQARQAKARLRDIAKARKIDDDINRAAPDRLRERAARWQKG